MWSQLVLCALVGLAFGSQNPGWKDSHQYVYEVRGRTLASLDGISNDYSGILVKCRLVVIPRPNGVLHTTLEEAQYAQVQAVLPEGWLNTIPDSQLQYQSLPISKHAFHIIEKNGAVRDLIVSNEIPNWEANFIKSIVSQFQLDTHGENLIDSAINTLPEGGDNTAVYKTMEDTVTGIAETLYEIHPLPEYIIQSQPWLIPRVELQGEDGEAIEIVKSKNYSRSEQRPAYHYGYYEMEADFDPASNKMGEFFSRTSVSRAVVTGKLERYTVQNAYTVDEIVIRPSQVDAQKGSVRSLVNVTLVSVKPHVRQGDSNDITNPISLGNLVYRFDDGFNPSNKVRSGKPFQRQAQTSGELDGDSQEGQGYQNEQGTNSGEGDYWQQEQPKLNEAPASPLLPFTVGYGGLSIKNKQNIGELVRKLSEQIGQDLQTMDKLPEVNTIGKFVTLASLVRVMDDKEMEQVAAQLYSKDQQGPHRAAWIAYRDAVSQAGTGPSLITLQEWIKTQKIQGEEAADAVEVQGRAARQPTEEYIRSFYQMVITPEVAHHKQLNESALLSLTRLVHRVYTNKAKSHNNFPVHSFGQFNTEGGRKFVEEELIPQLTQKLHQAVAKGDTQLIHIYIRALGNVGHRKILAAFEPYLEGTKQATQFQRLLMVISFDKLVRSEPTLARNVLYKIYQNAGDDEQVRAAAVFQLMRTAPSADVLQRMAVYTNTDPSEHVNAAVKSSIESAARLEGDDAAIAAFRQGAQTAKDLLTKKEYGYQYSRNQLRNYVVDHMKLAYKQTVQTIGSEDAFAADGWRYSLRTKLGGVRQEIINAHAMVSSIDDLVNVFQQQTKEYKDQLNRKQQQKSGEWTNEKIAQMLGMTVSNDEQLEGQLFVEHTLFQNLFSFDNRTLERLPQVIREIEEELKVGKQFHHTRMVIDEEKAIAFPTEMGWPLLYTYDKPAFTHVEGKLKGEATPRLAADGTTLAKPDQVKAEIELHGVFYGKTQTQLGFLTPFDHQKYTAGYDKNIQVQLPVSGKIQLDVKQNQLIAELTFNKELDKNSRLIHFSTWPYTYKGEILNWQTTQRNVIRKETPRTNFETVIGQQYTGIPLKVQYLSDEHMDLPALYNKLQQHDALSAVLGPWVDDRIQHCEFNVKVDLAQVTPQNNKMTIRMGVQHKYYSEGQALNNESQQQKLQLGELDKMSQEPTQRQQEFLKSAAAGIRSADAYSFDASVGFQTQQKKTIDYLLTAAIAKSNVDPKSRLIAHFRKIGGGKTFHAALGAKTHVPNTNGLNMDYAMKIEPTSTTQVELALGEDIRSATTFEAQIHLRKTEQRNWYLKQQTMYHDCHREMQQGNHQLPACANMTVRANFYDQLTGKVQYQNLRPEVLNATYKVYSLLRQALYPNTEENLIAGGNGKDEIEFQAQIDPEQDNANLTITTKNCHAKIANIAVEDWAKDMFVPHPVFHIRSRLMGRALGYGNYRPTCVLDKTAANTFNNKTYPLTLGTGDWTVMMQYVPRTAANKEQEQQQGEGMPAEKQLNQQIATYAVLVRNGGAAGQKEVKIVTQTPGTEQQNMEINMKPNGQGAPKLTVNGQEIKYTAEQSTDFAKGHIQIYALPNNEVKVELRGAFYIIYDGTRAKLTVTDGKFRSSVRGLCGSFTGDKNTDFQSPQQCILRDPLEFVASNTIMVAGQQNQFIANMQSNAQRRDCYQKEVKYANVISARDTGLLKGGQHQEQSNEMCTKHQTRYVSQNNGEICFTLRPLPVCKTECEQRGTVVKSVPVHCVAQSNSANLWKTQIDKGASPDFSLKSESRKVTMEIPRRCSP